MESSESAEEGAEDGEKRLAIRNELWRDLGLPPSNWADNADAPPVDRDLLNALFDQTLSERESLRVCELITQYRCWAAAASEVNAERSRIGAANPEDREESGDERC